MRVRGESNSRKRWSILNTLFRFRAPKKANYAQKSPPEAIMFAGSWVIIMF